MHLLHPCEDLLDTVGALAREGRFDTILIEFSGISEPMPVAATFDLTFDDGTSLSDHARLDTMVTVVDAAGFLAELVRGDGLVERDMQAAACDERSISDLLVDQVEFADVLVLNKTDLVTPAGLGTIESVLRKLNPAALIVSSRQGVVDLTDVLDTGRYDPITAARTPGWAAEPAGSHTPETEEYGISSVVYRAARPFHPARLLAALENCDGVLRSKGFCRIATRPDVLAVWSQAGPNLTFEPGELIGASDAVGQELVFIGLGVTVTDTYRRLDPALLTDAELAAGPDAWRLLPDPLPLHDHGDLHDHGAQP